MSGKRLGSNRIQGKAAQSGSSLKGWYHPVDRGTDGTPRNLRRKDTPSGRASGRGQPRHLLRWRCRVGIRTSRHRRGPIRARALGSSQPILGKCRSPPLSIQDQIQPDLAQAKAQAAADWTKLRRHLIPLVLLRPVRCEGSPA